MGCATGLAIIVVAQAFRPASARQLGKIDFPTSGSAKAQPHFLRGVAALHSFEYEEALDAFREAQTIDAGFAMAYWGEAMSRNRTLWGEEDADGARAALARLAPTPAARAARAPTAREKAYLEAVEILFESGDKQTRSARYADAMGKLARAYPQDLDAAAFYALSRLATVQRGIEGIAAEGMHRHALPGSETQREVAAILQKVLKTNPEHPGAAHYLIHAWDDRQHAGQALSIAKTYARIAPSASHARHMPAHVFFWLGQWDEAARSDESAWAASVAFVTKKRLPPSMRSYHSLSWLQYVYLQQGRVGAADRTIGEIEPVARSTGDTTLLAIAASMRARAVVDTGRWELVRGKAKFDNHDELFAIGLGAARTGDLRTADLARQELARRAAAPRTGDFRPIVAILERQMGALLRKSQDGQAAVALLRETATAEEQLPEAAGPPVVIKPTQELLGEVLLELGRPKEAATAFDAALKRYRNRSASVLGRARALAASGAREEARAEYKKFLANWHAADANRPELAEAKKVSGTVFGKPSAKTVPDTFFAKPSSVW
jgi:tetratricopeptide (TPR) repeat protein